MTEAVPAARRPLRRRSVVGAAAMIGASALLLSACSAPPLTELELHIGTLLPLSVSQYDEAGESVIGTVPGSGFAAEAGTALAVQDINAADLGMTITIDHADSGDLDSPLYEEAATGLVDAGATVIIGPGTVQVAQQVAALTAEDEVLLISPSDETADSEAWTSNSGFYWRTAPSETAQAPGLVELLTADGRSSVSIIVVQEKEATDLYDALLEGFYDASEDNRATDPWVYETGSADLNSAVDNALGFKTDAVVMIGDAEIGEMTRIALRAGFTADRIYYGGRSLQAYEQAADGSFVGIQAVGANPTLSEEFIQRLNTAYAELHPAAEGEAAPTLADYQDAAEAYDAVVVSALAAMQARSVEGADIRDKLREVTGGVTTDDTVVCTSFAECAALLHENTPIDYDGLSGGLAFGQGRGVTEANTAVFGYNADGSIAFIRQLGEEPADAEAEAGE